MIRGNIKSITQDSAGVLISIRIHYPYFPSQPSRDDFFYNAETGKSSQENYDEAMKAFELKKEIYWKEKQEIDLIRIGLINLFQDDFVLGQPGGG